MNAPTECDRCIVIEINIDGTFTGAIIKWGLPNYSNLKINHPVDSAHAFLVAFNRFV